MDFPRYEFLGPWIHIPIRYKENFDYETMLNKIISCLIFSVKWKEGKIQSMIFFNKAINSSSHNSNNVLIPRIFRNSSCYDLTEKDPNPEIDIFFLSCVDFSIHAPLSSKVCGFFNPHTLEKKNSCLMEKDWKIYSIILLSKILRT